MISRPIYKFLLLFSLVVTFISQASAQFKDTSSSDLLLEILDFTVDKYGVDQQLINGNFYENQYIHPLGHPFLFEDKYILSNLIIRDTEYKNVYSKYNIYTQSVVVKSSSDNFVVSMIIPVEFLTGFTFNNMLFRKNTLLGENPEYYQVVAETREIACFYFWYKTRYVSFHNVTYSSYKFSKSMHKKILVMNDSISEFKNNRTFIDLFPNEVQRDILTYLRYEKLNIKKVTDQDMNSIIQFCNNKIYQNSLK